MIGSRLFPRFLSAFVVLLLVLGSGFTRSSALGAAAKKAQTKKSQETGKATRKAAPGKKAARPAARKGGTARAKSRTVEPVYPRGAAARGLKEPLGNLLLTDPLMNQLHATALAFAESPTPQHEQELRRFATRNAGKEASALAYLALGYSALSGKRLGDAIEYLTAGRRGESPVPDYLDYYLAAAYLPAGRPGEAAGMLADFERHYPDSALMGRAVLTRAQAWIATGRAVEAASVVKSRLGALRRPEADMVLAAAYNAAGNLMAAVEAYRQVYYLYPGSAEADDAEREINRLGRMETIPPASLDLRRERASRLYDARLFRQAEDAFDDLIPSLSGAEREQAQVRRASCAYRSGRTAAAYSMLRALSPADAEADAERLHWLSQCQRRLSRDSEFLATVRELGERHATSGWHEEALFAAGNYYLVDRQLEQAAFYYRKVYELFPSGKYAALSHWRAGWWLYRKGDFEAARQQFEQHILRYPESPQISAALYWLGRIAENAGNRPAALAYFRKLAGGFPQYFYGTLAQKKLEQGPAAPVTTLPENVTRVLSAVRQRPVALAGANPPADLQLHKKKVEALEAALLIDLAVIELRHSTDDPAHGKYLLLELARLERDLGRYQQAIEHIRRVHPNYFAYSLNDLEPGVWKVLFPLPWWPAIQSNALRHGLDPYLVAALIRQESAFSPLAVSHAHAYGLMQLLPATARRTARSLGMRRPTTRTLFDPLANVEMGTKYLREVIDRYNGRLEPALASYNAGPDRVDVWLGENFREPAEFVESIPFTETREYVQALVRNTEIYHRLYGQRESAAETAGREEQ